MPTDRERWDAKYAGEAGDKRVPPDPFFLEALDRVEALRSARAASLGRAVDLAAGTGRHALELARRGWRTAAWDVSPNGLAISTERAREEGVAVETRAIDLIEEAATVAEELGAFDLVSVVSFLHRPLLPLLAAHLRPGGFLVYVTFTVDWPEDKPPRDFRLAPGELASALAPPLEILHQREEGGRAGCLARRRPIADDSGDASS